MAGAYYIRRNGKITGPHPIESVKAAAKAKKLTADDLISSSKDGPWENVKLPADKTAADLSDIQNRNASSESNNGPKLSECADCGGMVSRRASACPHCGAPVQTQAPNGFNDSASFGDGVESYDDLPPLPQSHIDSSRRTKPKKLSVGMARDGVLSFTGPYAQVFAVVEQSMKNCKVRIKEASAEKGLIRGKLSYGINPFGITVVSTMYASGGDTRVEISANLTDAFDTFGVCKKKVAEICDRIVDLAKSVNLEDIRKSSKTPAAPEFEDRAGVSFRGRAVTGFCLAIVGLLAGPLSVLGLIFSTLAINGMTTSSNQEGKGIAIAGLIISFIGVVGWAVILLNFLR